ncbi:MAG TPA: clostripain-related cysteine peptidase [Kofleriaceae bacterium]|nr:clostripain-related cysteine peptidase [Kofleriaceae bacterium]
MYAIAGDPDEHKRVTDAITDMHDALTTNQCNVAVQLQATSKTTRYWISKGRKVQTEVLPVLANAGEPASLTHFLNAAHQTFPARSSALVLWTHGSGLDDVHDYSQKHAHGGLGPDPNTHQFLSNAGLKQAIATSAQRRVEILGLNACWMGTFEVEYELRTVSDVQIASQVYAKPWPYGAIIAALTAAPDLSAEQLAKAIVASVHAEIMADKRRDAVSALRSGRAMDELAAAFDTYAQRVLPLIDADWKSVSQAVMVEAQRVDSSYEVDLMSLVHALGKQDLKAKIAAASVASTYRAMLLANAASAAHPGVHGLSIFCPKSTHVDLADAYQNTEFRTNSWALVLKAFQRKLAQAPIE